MPREGAVSIAEVLTAQVRIESYEAVAIVQALCTLVLESRMPIGEPTADLSGVRISASGTISAVPVGRHDPLAAVQYLGNVLSKTLPDKDFMFLRERVVEKTTSSPPHYSSVEELSDTLAYYERPDRAAQIREVYSRWEARPPSSTPPVPMYQRLLGPTLDDAAALYARHARSGALGLMGLAVGLGVGFLGFSALGSGSNQAPSQTITSSAVSSPDRPLALDSRVSRIAPSVVEPTFPRQPKPAATFPQESGGPPTGNADKRIAPPAPGVEPALSGQRELVATVPKKPRELPTRVAENRPSSPAPSETEGRRTTAGSVTRPLIVDLPPPLPTPPPERRAEENFVDGATQPFIYSARNADVIPPAMLFSQLPGPSPLASPLHDVPTVEIVVSERGTVDTVRYVVRPRNIAESVVITNGLSAAKAWRFRPALKDGHAVPYRLLVALSND